MPVTAKLSRKLYDVLSEDVVNELVEWFNLVDATYRGDLRELNELNFARSDAKMEQRLAESDARWERRLGESDAKWERRLAASDAKWEHRLAQVDSRFEQVEARIAQVEAKMEARFVQFEERMAREFAVQRAELLKWMFLFWATTALGVIGLVRF